MNERSSAREPNSAAPAADDVARRVRDYCARQRLRPGERIGSERQLAEMLGIARTQLRTTLDQLEREGLVQRRLGRSGGIFVNNGRIQRHLNTIEGVPDMVRQQGLTLRTIVLSAEAGSPLPDETRNLGIGSGDLVYRVSRLRLVEGQSWSLDLSVLPAASFPRLLERDLTQSLYGTLRNVYGREPDRADEALEVCAATPEQAELLRIAPGAPLLEIWRVTFDEFDTPIEFAHDFFRADRTRVHMQKYGTNWKRAMREPRRPGDA